MIKVFLYKIRGLQRDGRLVEDVSMCRKRRIEPSERKDYSEKKVIGY
jgi:hypothetical protein